jgi:hypothetical protein
MDIKISEDIRLRVGTSSVQIIKRRLSGESSEMVFVKRDDELSKLIDALVTLEAE